MEKLPWFDGYSGQSTQELLAMEGRFRTDSLVCAFEQAIQEKGETMGVENLSKKERFVLAVESLEREVNNGGYEQFFTNSSVAFTPIVCDALRAIDRSDIAELTERALGVLGINGTEALEVIVEAVDPDNDELLNKLNELDSWYYANAGCLSGHLLRWIKTHQDQIQLGEPSP